MASLAESSVASVPIRHLTKLQHQLLQHREVSWTALRAEDEDDDHDDAEATTFLPSESLKARIDDSHHSFRSPEREVTAVIRDSINAHRTPHRPPPRLSPSKSAPPLEMEAGVRPSSSQIFRAMTRADSFHGYLGGDTQPMESQVYRDYRASMVQAPIAPPLMPTTAADGDTATTDQAPRACVEGETGFVDVANARQSTSPPAQSEPDTDDFLESPQAWPPIVDGAVAERPTMPETPATAGRKHARDGAVLTSGTTARKTPAFSQLFGGGSRGPLLSATQLFDQTQAPSSPLPDGPRSDPVLTRPSPNLRQHYSLSSPSSPPTTVRSKASAVVTEPRARYTNMRESQEKGTAQLEQHANSELDGTVDEGVEEDDSGDNTDGVRSQSERKRRQRVMSDRALSSWTKSSAPVRLGSRPTSSPRKIPMIDLITPATNRKRDEPQLGFTADGNGSDDEIASDDEDAENDQGMDEEDKLELEVEENAVELEEDFLGDTVEQDEMDMSDELTHTVLRSQPQYELDEAESVAGSSGAIEEQGVYQGVERHPDGELQPAFSNAVASHGSPGTANETIEQTVANTQHSEIADSQAARPSQSPARQLEHVANQQSSTSFFVPGSQYGNKPSQDRRQLTSTGPWQASGSRSPIKTRENKIPSSPPLPVLRTVVSEDSSAVSLARMRALSDVRTNPNADNAEALEDQAIPESDLPGLDDIRPQSASNFRFQGRDKDSNNNNDMQPYSTARTHLSDPRPSSAPRGLQPSPLRTVASQRSTSASPSPRKTAGVRPFREIAANSTPPNGTGESQLDVDAIINGVMTAEDHKYIEAISSPPNERAHKKRRLAKPTLSQDASQQAPNHQPTPPPQMPPLDIPSQARDNDPIEPPSIIRNSSSRDNELLVPTPPRVEGFASTPESVKRREAAGASAVSQLLSTRSRNLARQAEHSGKGSARGRNAPFTSKGKLKRPTKIVKLKANWKASSESIAERRKGRGVPQPQVSTLHMSPEPPVAADEPPALPDVPETHGYTVEHPEEQNEIDQALPLEIVAPVRVFAHCKGQYNKFYPATWVASLADGHHHRVQFDDTTEATVGAHQICQLDLRLGDVVKIDGAGMSSKTWVIKGFGAVARSDEDRSLGTDMYGRTTAKVQAKATRNRSGRRGAGDQSDGEIVEVLVTNICLPPSMWSRFSDRIFTPPDIRRRATVRAETPSGGLPTPIAGTPGSRTRRSTLPKSNSTGIRSFYLDGDPAVAVRDRTETGLFAGMAFAVSFGSDNVARDSVTRHIQDGGGIILDGGFDELFQNPSLDEPPKMSPANAHSRGNAAALQLKAEYQDLGFVALITDEHSRRPKYLQALSLGLPTLSWRWIIDSLAAFRDGPTPALTEATLPWARYLLPAGESTCLAGAVRSRTLPVYAAGPSKLADVLAARDLLLSGDGVLIVRPKKGKGAAERRKAFAFLTLALGAGQIRHVEDVDEAVAWTAREPEQWRWIYVDRSVATVGAKASGLDVGAGQKGNSDVNVQTLAQGDGRIKMVNDEFVVQSLILGALAG